MTHDADDGMWQFLDGAYVSDDDGAVMWLYQILDYDPSIEVLFDLPFGWIAWRENVNSDWKKQKKDW